MSLRQGPQTGGSSRVIARRKDEPTIPLGEVKRRLTNA